MPNSDNWPRYVLELPKDAIGFESNLPIEDNETIGLIRSAVTETATIERRGNWLIRTRKRVEQIETRRVRKGPARDGSGLRYFSLF